MPTKLHVNITMVGGGIGDAWLLVAQKRRIIDSIHSFTNWRSCGSSTTLVASYHGNYRKCSSVVLHEPRQSIMGVVKYVQYLAQQRHREKPPRPSQKSG